jgi:alkanesulfonate monooxygenase SsuD/methylene tetrahydromethanopterin reductase-like flavin-dependent oxidoreductase (luciferase family)
MDTVWLTEHHFDGAVAMRTRRVRIGFAVVEMALHHPVRLAVQTSLLDHRSRGRLIVGTGRGSGYNLSRSNARCGCLGRRYFRYFSPS